MTNQFPSHLELLHSLLTHRAAIVDNIEHLLNCQKEPLAFQQDRAQLALRLQACFTTASASTRVQAGLRKELEQARRASGFEPRAEPGNDIVDAAEQLLRALHFWRQTRWPGHKGRVHFAHTLFNLYLLRWLALLCLRLWDGDEGNVPARITLLQQVLDKLWRSSPPGQPVLVRDVRWLLPVTLSPTTDSLAGYFDVAERIAQTFTEQDRLETHKAWVLTGAGHLRSQLRHLSMQRAVALDDEELVLLTRRSNALDVALLVQGLVTKNSYCLRAAPTHWMLRCWCRAW